jgi:ComEC/Rec2-related protein
MLREIESRPLVLLAAALVVGLTAVDHPSNLIFLFAALVVFKGVRNWSILAAGLVLGLVLTPAPVRMIDEPTYVQGVAKIISIPHEADDFSYADAEIDGSLVRLRCPASLNIHDGDEWNVRGVIRPLSEIAEKTLLPQGVRGTLSINDGTRSDAGPTVFAWSDAMRRGFSGFAAKTLPEDEAAWLDQLCFRTGSLNPQDQKELNEAGAGYLVAASGLQVYVLAALLVGLMTGLRAPRWLALAVVALVLLAYCLSTGAHLSTVRAALACCLFASAYLVRREPDALSALAFAVVGFLLFSPAAVYSLGFTLTVVVIGALALFMRRAPSRDLRLRDQVLTWLWQGATAAMVVIVAGQPIMAWYAGRFSLGAIPANVMSGAVAPVAVGLGFVGYAAGWISQSLGAGILTFSAALADYLKVVTQWVGGASLGFDVPAFSVWWLVAYYGLWLAVWRPRAVMA